MSDKPKFHLIISSHVDTVPGFNGKTAWTVEGVERGASAILRGTLDNLAGSAIVLACMPFLLNEVQEFVFTDGEENGVPNMDGANRVITHIREAGIDNPLVLVVDVANAHGTEDVIVGNAYRVNLELCAKLLKLNGLNAVMEKLDFDNEDDEDETWAYAKAGIPCVALYLPVHGDFHTPNAWTTVDRIAHLRTAIMGLAHATRNLESTGEENQIVTNA